jgi:hypothetical protein
MGLIANNGTFLAKVMPLTATNSGTPDSRPAWVFQNQSGTLGTNLDSSVIYCGVMPADASISVIMPGTDLASVDAFALSTGGTGYTAAAGLPTTTANVNASGLTVNTTVVGGAITAIALGATGSGYNVGDIITVVQGGGSGGTAVITKVGNGTPISAQAITFVGLQSGSILPVSVDYVTGVAGTGVTVLDFLIGR